MSESEEPRRRVIGTPSSAPAALDRLPDGGGDGRERDAFTALPTDPEDPARAKRIERIVALCFIIAFFAGVGFIAAYVGIEVGPSSAPQSDLVDEAFRSNLALGLSLAIALLAIATGSMLWVRHLTPNIEIVEHRHELRSTPEARAKFEEDFRQGSQLSQIPKRPLLRRTMLLATVPLAVAPIVLLRDLGPLPGDSLRVTAWRKGLRAVVYGTNRPLRPSDISTPGSMITVIPEGFQDDADALAKAGVILIKFAPGELQVPTVYNGKTLLYSMNWTVDNIVAYSKICTHVGCPVALYEQTTHHILCPCHQSTFDAAHGANVIFGPAARALPQLPLGTDAEGYLVALDDFTQPVGPSFWERG